MQQYVTRWMPLLAAFVAFSVYAGESVEVQMRDYKFEPAELRIKIGTAVRWMNVEKRVSHSVLFLGAEGFESERMFPGESYQRIFDKPGKYSYTCGPHPEMKGVVEVAD